MGCRQIHSQAETLTATLKKAWETIYNWRELWLWPLVAFLNLELLLGVAYWVTGHWPQEGLESLVGIGINLFVVTLAISATSMFKESTGIWWNKEELKANKTAQWTSTIARIFVFAVIVWALKH